MILSPAIDHMFHLPLPFLEKMVRPVIVYLVLVLLVRIFGKRELAQLNPFDLVVLLSLSNTVQNAIIGDDNSISGGVIGAFSLLAINWLVARVLFRSRKLRRIFEGQSTVLLRNGQLDQRALEREALTREELLDAIHRQGFAHFHDCRRIELEPSGTFFIEGMDPSVGEKYHSEVIERLDKLTLEVASLRPQRSGG